MCYYHIPLTVRSSLRRRAVRSDFPGLAKEGSSRTANYALGGDGWEVALAYVQITRHP